MLEKNSSLVFIVKKTNQLTSEDLEQLLLLHNKTMNKKRTKRQFEDKYSLNFLGFSFHSLMICNNKIVGCNTAIPQEFIFFKKKYTFGQWCETLIDDKFRGMLSNFKKLGNILNKELLKNNIYFIYGLPNRTLYIVSKRLLGMKDIVKLDYYVYPIKLNKFLIKYYPLNNLLSFFIKFLIKFRFKFKKRFNNQIQKIYNNSFHQSRYNNNEDYRIFNINDCKIIYKIDISERFNKAKIIWIVDILPLYKLNLENAVDYLRKKYDDIDLIIYIGKISSLPYNLIKIPSHFIKENNIVSGKILDEDKIDNSIFDYKNWNINSSNFDYR